MKLTKTYAEDIKRVLDFIVSLVALILLSPIILILSLLIRFYLGSPVLFQQDRPGYHAKIFTIYKFRTMTDERDENNKLLPDHMRLTKFGRLLRSTSLDELPELWNILKGDMSFIGPRPLLIKYLKHYNKEQGKRHDVRPGLSGYAQVNGRNSISWEDKFNFDIYYVNHLSPWLDFKIFCMTIIKVLKHKDINFDEELSNTEFTGTENELDELD